MTVKRKEAYSAFAKPGESVMPPYGPQKASAQSVIQRQMSASMPCDFFPRFIIESGPMPAVHGVVRWRLIDLGQWRWEEFRLSVSKQTLSRELRAMGYRKLSARPRHHAQAEGAIEAFKKTGPPRWQPSPRRRTSPPRP